VIADTLVFESLAAYRELPASTALLTGICCKAATGDFFERDEESVSGEVEADAKWFWHS